MCTIYHVNCGFTKPETMLQPTHFTNTKPGQLYLQCEDPHYSRLRYVETQDIHKIKTNKVTEVHALCHIYYMERKSKCSGASILLIKDTQFLSYIFNNKAHEITSFKIFLHVLCQFKKTHKTY